MSNTTFDSLTHKMERAAAGKLIDVALSQVHKDRQKAMVQMVDFAKQFYGDSFSEETYDHARLVLGNPDSKWSKLINCVLDQTNPNVARTTALNLGYEAFFRGTKTIRENRVKYQCNIPWLILFDPTSACNMHCVGCWAGEYGHKNNLSFADMDKIITQGKELGVYLYMLTGGEPLVRKADILKLAEKHNDVQFAIYTNSTLIDEPFCKEVVRLGNIAFMLSIEGTPSTNDARRGEGHYDAVMHAMDLLKEYGILFGTSICYTSANLEAVTSDHFMRMLCEKGAHFGFYFHYMPVGNDAAPELMPSPAQRKYMIDRIRYLRSEKSDIPFYPWTSRTTASLWAAASPADATTSISTRRATRSPASLSTTPTPTSTTAAFWRSCTARCLWRTTTASRSTRTTCAPARCWKTPSCCARWCTRRGPTTRICSRRRRWTTCVISARLTRRAGSPWRMRSGPTPKSKRAATRTIKIGNPLSDPLSQTLSGLPAPPKGEDLPLPWERGQRVSADGENFTL